MQTDTVVCLRGRFFAQRGGGAARPTVAHCDDAAARCAAACAETAQQSGVAQCVVAQRCGHRPSRRTFCGRVVSDRSVFYKKNFRRLRAYLFSKVGGGLAYRRGCELAVLRARCRVRALPSGLEAVSCARGDATALFDRVSSNMPEWCFESRPCLRSSATFLTARRRTLPSVRSSLGCHHNTVEIVPLKDLKDRRRLSLSLSPSVVGL